EEPREVEARLVRGGVDRDRRAIGSRRRGELAPPLEDHAEVRVCEREIGLVGDGPTEARLRRLELATLEEDHAEVHARLGEARPILERELEMRARLVGAARAQEPDAFAVVT